MARSVSDEELQLRRRARRRLIGAVVAVAVVVVALPMVLDSEPKQMSQEIDIRIPSPDSSPPFTSKVAPLPDSGSAPKPVPETKPEASAPPAKQAQAPTAPPKPQASAPETAKPAAPKQQASAPESAKSAAAQVPGKPSGSKGGSYVVQVVALSDAQKAKQIERQIGTAGIKSYTEVVKTARGDVTRVRAGPFATREAAEKAQQQLKGMGLDGKVIPGK